MAYSLRQAREFVALAEEHVLRQREVICRLAANGADAQLIAHARAVLFSFQTDLQLLRKVLAKLEEWARESESEAQ